MNSYLNADLHKFVSISTPAELARMEFLRTTIGVLIVIDLCYTITSFSLIIPLIFIRMVHRTRYVIFGSFLVKVAMTAAEIMGNFPSPFEALLGTYSLPKVYPIPAAIIELLFSSVIFYLMYYMTLPRPRVLVPNSSVYQVFSALIHDHVRDPRTYFPGGMLP